MPDFSKRVQDALRTEKMRSCEPNRFPQELKAVWQRFQAAGVTLPDSVWNEWQQTAVLLSALALQDYPARQTEDIAAIQSRLDKASELSLTGGLSKIDEAYLLQSLLVLAAWGRFHLLNIIGDSRAALLEAYRTAQSYPYLSVQAFPIGFFSNKEFRPVIINTGREASSFARSYDKQQSANSRRQVFGVGTALFRGLLVIPWNWLLSRAHLFDPPVRRGTPAGNDYQQRMERFDRAAMAHNFAPDRREAHRQSTYLEQAKRHQSIFNNHLLTVKQESRAQIAEVEKMSREDFSHLLN